jgi:Ca-activated chloride channel homolog
MLLVLLAVATSPAAVRETLQQGNRLYGDKQYAEAVNKYNDALVGQPQAVEPKFNKANSYYRLDDLSAALDLYQQVAAESKDMSLVAKAKYNLGNCYFQRGTKQRDSDLKKAVEDMETSIANWRQVLDLDPQNQKAAKNIEVARLTIKDLLDQMKKQQQNQQNQKNQQDQQKQQQQQQQNQGQQQDQSKSQKDPNQPQDPNQAKKAEPKSDPNQAKQEPKPAPEQKKEAKAAPDATAREIIDTEQQQKKEREALQQRSQYREVEKDW